MTSRDLGLPAAPVRQYSDSLLGQDLRFGANLALGTAETASQARWMEELGLEYLSSGEHFMRGNPPGATQAALPLLAVAAGATERIRLLSSIILAGC